MGYIVAGVLAVPYIHIIIKAFNDLGLHNRKFTGIVFGTLIVEDLVAILMMVLLSTMAVTRDFAVEAMIESILKAVFFLILWFLVGIYILPVFFKKAKKLMNDETLLVISLGLCLGMVVLATTTLSPLLILSVYPTHLQHGFIKYCRIRQLIYSTGLLPVQGIQCYCQIKKPHSVEKFHTNKIFFSRINEKIRYSEYKKLWHKFCIYNINAYNECMNDILRVHYTH